MTDTPEAALERAIKICGSRAELARRTGISRMAVSQWKVVPMGRVLEVERATGGEVSRHELCPDRYPHEGEAA